MKKILLIVAIVSISTSCFAQTFGIGIQSSFLTHGISGKVKINDNNTIQAILTALGPYSSYQGRYLYGFDKTDVSRSLELQPFLFGMAAFHTYSYDTWSFFGGYEKTRSTSFGYGFGAGLEWNLTSLENLGVSQEISYSNANLAGYNWSYMHYGFGLHYYFGN